MNTHRTAQANALFSLGRIMIEDQLPPIYISVNAQAENITLAAYDHGASDPQTPAELLAIVEPWIAALALTRNRDDHVRPDLSGVPAYWVNAHGAFAGATVTLTASVRVDEVAPPTKARGLAMDVMHTTADGPAVQAHYRHGEDDHSDAEPAGLADLGADGPAVRVDRFFALLDPAGIGGAR